MIEETGIYDPRHWTRQLPQPPQSQLGGAPLLLRPQAAGRILVRIAHGIEPRTAFSLEGISPYTYDRYRKRARLKQRQDTEAEKYLKTYFELQDLAIEASCIQVARQQMQAIQTKPKKEVSIKRIRRSRQAVCKGQVVTLEDVTTHESVRWQEQPPALPKIFMNFVENEPVLLPFDIAKPQENSSLPSVPE